MREEDDDVRMRLWRELQIADAVKNLFVGNHQDCTVQNLATRNPIDI